MLRKLVDYKKLSHEVAVLLIETYPHGYGDSDIIAFKNMHGETIEAVEVKTDEVIYLIKISKSLSNFIANFDDSIVKELKIDSKPNLSKREKKIELLIGNELQKENSFD
ncbi:hypothetical protein H0I23_06880 [Cellulophaga sp. HaHaR_3_176]|uniref:hypothetical protein n=1 Tax=Cellulophaga sp. HaHaR_3_176 TaxID=1942464 RepID=UPI001C1F4A31|nr:hypothetical protein [Cellulophaga sp. HaHaR_3_176]QWX85358.1 hypothetical protein H0I23_06880 [Cellulophaga sp. HaHaR_3_176]